MKNIDDKKTLSHILLEKGYDTSDIATLLQIEETEILCYWDEKFPKKVAARELNDSGIPFPEIARELDVSVTLIYEYRKMDPTPWKNSMAKNSMAKKLRKETAWKLAETGLSVSEIAKTMGTDSACIYCFIREDREVGVVWPPQTKTCLFCDKEFPSPRAPRRTSNFCSGSCKKKSFSRSVAKCARRKREGKMELME